MELKANIGDPKSGRTLKKVFSEDDAKPFIGKRMGVVIKGDLIGFPGYEFEITGGSDYCGFPMRKDVQGIARKKVLTTKGFGNKIAKRKGLRYRRTVAGNTIYSKTAQVNLKVVKYGKDALFEEKPKEEKQAEKEEKPEGKKEQKPEAKPEAKATQKPEEKSEEQKKEEAPKEDNKKPKPEDNPSKKKEDSTESKTEDKKDEKVDSTKE